MSFRFGIVPDLHVLEAQIDWQRDWLEEHVVRRFMELHEQDPFDAFLVTGDLSGLKVPHIARPSERCVVSEALAALARMAPVVVCRGNHDLLGDWDHLNLVPNVFFVDEPELLRLDNGCAVMVLPWLDAAQVEGKGDWSDRVRSAYMNAIEDAAVELQEAVNDAKAARVLLCHGVVHGARLTEGQPRLPYSVPSLPSDLYDDPTLFDAAVFGHVHFPHTIGAAKVFTLHAGSCFTSRHGEDRKKGPFVLVVQDPGPKRQIGLKDSICPSIARLMWKMTVKKQAVVFEDIGAEPIWSGEAPWPKEMGGSALVKLRVEASREHEATVVDAVNRLRLDADKLNIGQLTIEYRWTQTVRAREGAVEVSKAKTASQRATQFWGSQTNGPSPKVRRRALELIKDLEQDVQRAV